MAKTTTTLADRTVSRSAKTARLERALEKASQAEARAQQVRGTVRARLAAARRSQDQEVGRLARRPVMVEFILATADIDEAVLAKVLTEARAKLAPAPAKEVEQLAAE